MLKKLDTFYNENIFDDLKRKNAILTAGDKKIGFNSLTVSWGGIGVLWGRDVAYVFVRKSRHTYSFLERSESITLSFLDEKYKESVLYVGTHSGKNEDKIKNANLSYTYDPDYDGAYITQATYCFKMKKLYSINLPYENLAEDIKKQYYGEGDSHTMYVCEIKQFLVTEEYNELH
ncbi:MAG: flavin reductase family protein [Roseburia sp.]|nr:flavin reductase family protein [Anaeroplasma bactoclasticum]MCM1196830.1 flavin reductase family protein [Roseburia sp.]MCM1557433.1 flavin reductase family protein [Anaeroplasma bactoclasticum]